MLKVLLVDDEYVITQGLSVLIDWGAEGYEIAAVCSNGQDALDYLRENPVDLVIADVMMPVMTGLELLEKAQAVRMRATAPVEGAEEVEALIAQRAEAKKAKDWGRADAIRDQLKEMGIEIKDTPNGVEWKRI